MDYAQFETEKTNTSASDDDYYGKQRDFFWEYPAYLKPLALKEVAEELSVHESTISRATRNKYVQTPHGLFEMKSFFSNAVSTTEDEAVSTKRVKQFIQTLVEAENKKSHSQIKRFQNY